MSGTPLLEVRDLRCGYGETEVVHGISFSMARGEFVCVMGANGCGKTTAMKTMLRLLKPWGGDVLIEGKSLEGMGEKEIAKKIAYIPQTHNPPFPFSVADVVLMGRTPYMGRFSRIDGYDRSVASRAMELMGVDRLAGFPFTSLSGGQQQLVLIARALAQQPRLLVMDEPTASLDFGNQQLVMRQMRLLSSLGVSVIMVTHDPNHALYYADKALVIERGRVIAYDEARNCVTDELLARIYRIPAKIVPVNEEGCPTRICVPLIDREIVRAI